MSVAEVIESRAKQEALYEKSRNIFNNRLKRVWFKTYHYLEKEGRHVDPLDMREQNVHTRYVAPLQSLVVCEKILTEGSVFKQEIEKGDLWMLLFSEAWEEGSAVRVFEGELYTWLDTSLRELERSGHVRSQEKYVYGNSVIVTKPTMKATVESATRFHEDDTVRISYTYFGLVTHDSVHALEADMSRVERTDEQNFCGVIVVDDDLMVDNAEVAEGDDKQIVSTAGSAVPSAERLGSVDMLGSVDRLGTANRVGSDMTVGSVGRRGSGVRVASEEIPCIVDVQSPSATAAQATPTPPGHGTGAVGKPDGSMLGLTAEIPRDLSGVSDATNAQATGIINDVSNLTGIQLSEIPRDFSNRTEEQVAELPHDRSDIGEMPRDRSYMGEVAHDHSETGRVTQQKSSKAVHIDDVIQVVSFVKPPLFVYDDMYIEDDVVQKVETIQEKLTRRKKERMQERFSSDTARLKHAKEEKKYEIKNRFERLKKVGKILQDGLDAKMKIPNEKAMKTLSFEWYILRLLYDELRIGSPTLSTAGSLFQRYNKNYFRSDLMTDKLIPSELLEDLNQVYKVGNATETQIQTKRIRNRKVLQEIFDRFLGTDFLDDRKDVEVDLYATGGAGSSRKLLRRDTYGASVPESRASRTTSHAGNQVSNLGLSTLVKPASVTSSVAGAQDRSSMMLGRTEATNSHSSKRKPDVVDTAHETASECFDRISRVLDLNQLSFEKTNMLKSLLKTDFRYLINCVLSITMSEAFRNPLLQHFAFLKEQMGQQTPADETARSVHSSASGASGVTIAQTVRSDSSSSLDLKPQPNMDVKKVDRDTESGAHSINTDSSSTSLGYKYWILGHPRRGFKARQLYLKKLKHPSISYTFYGVDGELILGPTSNYIKSAFKRDNPPYDELVRRRPKCKKRDRYNPMHYAAVGGWGINTTDDHDTPAISHMGSNDHRCHHYGKVSKHKIRVEDHKEEVKHDSKFKRMNRRYSIAVHRDLKNKDKGDTKGSRLGAMASLSERYALLKSAHARFGNVRASLDLAWKPKIHASKLAVFHDAWSTNSEGTADFKERLLEAMQEFVVRRELVTSSYGPGFRTISCITFSRPFQFSSKHFLSQHEHATVITECCT